MKESNVEEASLDKVPNFLEMVIKTDKNGVPVVAND